MNEMIALIITISSYVFGYFLQKKCPKSQLKFKGKKIGSNKKMFIAEIYEAIIKDKKYFVKCVVKETQEDIIIPIDKEMMAVLPDNMDIGKNKENTSVLVFGETMRGVTRYELCPEEIRFKIRLAQNSDDDISKEEFTEMEEEIQLIYQVRLVMYTVAFLSAFRSPTLATLISIGTFVINFQNIAPLRYTKYFPCGIIKKRNGEDEGIKKDNTKVSEHPPGYDGWTDNQKYMHSLNEGIHSAKRSLDEEDEPLKPEQSLPVVESKAAHNRISEEPATDSPAKEVLDADCANIDTEDPFEGEDPLTMMNDAMSKPFWESESIMPAFEDVETNSDTKLSTGIKNKAVEPIQKRVKNKSSSDILSSLMNDEGDDGDEYFDKSEVY